MGKPIVRDCACRGNDAGFAHTSCIIKYAKQKCEQALNLDTFTMPWEQCPICHQDYQNDLAIQLADAFVSFAEITYGYPGNDLIDKMKIMDALRLHIQSIRSGLLSRWEKVNSAKHEIEILIHKLLEKVDRAKEEHDMKGWVHMDPTTTEFRNYKHICSVYEAYGYICFGQLYLLSNSEESTNFKISCYEKAREIYQSVGIEHLSKNTTDEIARARAELEGNYEGDLIGTKNLYYKSLEVWGENSTESIMMGISYAASLRLANCSIKAERLVTKLIAISRRVYGDEHRCYKIPCKLLNQCKSRFIHKLSPKSGGNVFVFGPRYKALHYVNDGTDCLVNGPISGTSPFNEDEEGQTFRIASSQFFPAIGCPVICHGLMNASHLNGKLGDVRSVSVAKDSGGTLRLGVYFEDESLKTAAVKPENLRIAFDLPSV